MSTSTTIVDRIPRHAGYAKSSHEQHPGLRETHPNGLHNLPVRDGSLSSLEPPRSLEYAPRIRRVKCDEAKPQCTRCLLSKRTCDGYLPAGGTHIPRRALAVAVRSLASIGPVSRTLAANPDARPGILNPPGTPAPRYIRGPSQPR